jgi:cyclopropane fatty-acyl-phospholipid synthase-like methyltransferase
MDNGWNEFWKKRDRRLTMEERKIFGNNFAAMYALISHYFWRCGMNNNLSSLEIGCGRATISDYLIRAGFDTWTMDRILRQENNHVFLEGDVLQDKWPTQEAVFDLIVSYGLLEHFTHDNQMQIINNCDKYLSFKGMQLHYVVPKKLVNIKEDKSVYRDKCSELIRMSDALWVYPIFGKRWVTNRYLGKAFIIYSEKSHENTSIGNCQVTKH